MGIFDSVVNGIQNVSKNIEDNKNLTKKKNRILNRFTLRQLQYMAKNYNIKVQPSSISGIMEKRNPVTDDYVICIRRKLSYEEILNYAKKRNLDISDIIQEEKEKKAVAIKEISSSSTPVNDSNIPETSIVCEAIKQKIDSFELDFAVNSEDEFEKHLYQYLKYVFPNYEINRQVPCGDGLDRVDLAVYVPDADLNIGIELKLGTNKNHLRNARAQVEDYSNFFDFTILVVLDIDNFDVDVYSDLAQKIKVYGVDLIIVNGQLSERKSIEVKKKEKIIKELIK